MSIKLSELDSPLGTLVALHSRAGLHVMEFGDRWLEQADRYLRLLGSKPAHAPAPKLLASALKAYFEGRLDALDSIEVDLHGTPFQHRVWKALRGIKPGRTLSYGELARRIRRPAAARAVAAANGANPVALVIPCHRVIAGNGKLWGYGGGLDRKHWLLVHEGAIAPSA
jgi:methylated-DNA-[protein]-cysteine S-methyltransferase